VSPCAVSGSADVLYLLGTSCTTLSGTRWCDQYCTRCAYTFFGACISSSRFSNTVLTGWHQLRYPSEKQSVEMVRKRARGVTIKVPCPGSRLVRCSLHRTAPASLASCIASKSSNCYTLISRHVLVLLSTFFPVCTVCTQRLFEPAAHGPIPYAELRVRAH